MNRNIFGSTFPNLGRIETVLRLTRTVFFVFYLFPQIHQFDGVSSAFAIQAGRELRVMVESAKVTDEVAHQLSYDISEKIQNELTYPGQVKVTVIRETRAVNIAR